MPDEASVAPQWQPDILGVRFESLTLDLGEDDEGPLVATLVRSLPRPVPFGWLRNDPRPLSDVDVLYIHGWSDYFFQYPLADFFTDRGARFFAIDLRKYGRSLREGQTPGYVTDLTDYDQEIEAALKIIKANSSKNTPPRRLFLLGHSTGGLTLSLWASRHRGAADALILNSPWLEFQLSSVVRSAITPLVNLHATVRPHESVPQVDLGFYARAQSTVIDPDEPFAINEAWRPEQAAAVRAGWLGAILSGHAAVHSGLDIDVPICVLLSARSGTPTRWSEDLARVDSVLVVDDIARAALKLGSSVTVERIEGALHDVFISERGARREAYNRMDRWLRGVNDATRRSATAPSTNDAS
ncbi:Lysophospholipase, alpha-beta hydrolase superfamily [Micrococcales bacterium KH10]|nr:Lysophospholipase, alpha-beta hydrolase superfamily [Micrococcales bacterium KH10]